MGGLLSGSEKLLNEKKALALFLFLVGYCLTYILSCALYFDSEHSTVMWLNNGLSLAVLLIFKIRLWPVLFGLMLVLHLWLAYFVYHRPPVFTVFAAVADTLEPLLIAWWIRRWLPGLEKIFSRRGAILAFCALLAGTALGALIGASGIHFSYSHTDFGMDWMRWAFGDIVGTLLVAPVIVGWLRVDRQDLREMLSLKCLAGIWGFLGVTALLAQLAFGDTKTHLLLAVQFPYLLILLLLLSSLHFHPRIIASATLLATVILVANAIGGHGPFLRSHQQMRPNFVIFNIQLYLGMTSLITLTVSAIMTERRKALASLEISEALYRGIVEDQTEFICRSRPDLTLTFANEAYCRHYRRSCPELVGESFLPLVHPDDRARVSDDFTNFNPEKPVFSFECRVLTQEGAVRWHQWVIRAIFDARGRLAEFQGVGRDITERKRAEDALHAILEGTSQAVGKDFFRNLVQQLARAVEVRYALVCELVSKYPERARTLAFWADNDFVENFEYELEHTPCGDIYQRDVCFFPSNVQEAFPHDEVLKQMGIESYIGMPFRDSTGRVTGHVAVMHDRPLVEAPLAESLLKIFAGRAATELERLRYEQMLQEASRRKDEFLAMLAHELRNPLAPIRNAVQILRTVGSDRPILQRQHEIIDRQVRHMAHLLDDLLDISRFTRGKIELKRHPVVLAEALRQAVEIASPGIESHLQNLQVSMPPYTLRVEGDFDRLVQVVGNLLNNASKYTDQEGEIWLEAGREQDFAVIRVRDNGIGIDPSVLPHIFELFTQADLSLDRSQGGLGIGLTMAQKIVQMHGGSIEGHSAGLGQGSEFIVRLPALPEEAMKTEESEKGRVQSAYGSKPHRILVVDDVIDSARSLAELLEMWGHEVHVSYDGPSALAEARHFHPDVVLLDIGLPGMDGYEVVRRLREEHGPHTMLIIALTGYGQEYDRQRACELGFDQHIVKPVNLDYLKQLLGAVASH